MSLFTTSSQTVGPYLKIGFAPLTVDALAPPKICDNRCEEPNFRGGRALRPKQWDLGMSGEGASRRNRAIMHVLWQSPLSEFIPLAPDAIFWNNRLLRSPLGP